MLPVKNMYRRPPARIRRAGINTRRFPRRRGPQGLGFVEEAVKVASALTGGSGSGSDGGSSEASTGGRGGSTQTPTAMQQQFTPQLAPVFQQVGDSPGATATATNLQYAPGGQTASQPSADIPFPGMDSSPLPSFPSYGGYRAADFMPLASGALDIQRQTSTAPLLAGLSWNLVAVLGVGLLGLLIWRSGNRPRSV